MGQVFDKVIHDIEQNSQQMLSNVSTANLNLGMNLQAIIDAILMARTNRDVPSSSALVQKVNPFSLVFGFNYIENPCLMSTI